MKPLILIDVSYNVNRMIMHQLDNLQIDYDVEIPILLENSFSELKHYSCNRSYHAYMDT